MPHSPLPRDVRLASRLCIFCFLWAFPTGVLASEFEVFPYLQNPAPEAMTVVWFTGQEVAGTLEVATPDGPVRLSSQPELAETLQDNPWKPEFEPARERTLYRHRVRVTGLKAGTQYGYKVTQQAEVFEGSLRTTPTVNSPVRLVFYSDSETEPESSTTPPVDWPAPPGAKRPEGRTRYLVDQTEGYRRNLAEIERREPHLVSIVGDLVETGGEQRDWDEFWRHNAGEYGRLASRVPLIAALGNHENYAGAGGGYTAKGANFATAKYLTYFEFPNNGAQRREHVGRYYRLDYGPVTVLCLDSSDGGPHQTEQDTNFNLSGSQAPDYNPGSEQYQWLERELPAARQRSRFVFVQFHHTMFGSGPHSVPLGHKNFSGQSGRAMRVLLPLLMKHGVDAVFSGHDELWERSEATGERLLPDGKARPHTIHFYDVGAGGDGLRGPMEGYENPGRKFLAHLDSPEVWDGLRLVSGGKHYGHLEVNVTPDEKGRWRAELLPVYMFPVTDSEGRVTGWERRLYEDVVTLTAP
ncbi:MAG: metallophosphoesterase [Planctomycetaceae bacterium]